MSADDEEMVISLLKDEFEPEGIKVFSISAVSGKRNQGTALLY